MKNGNRFTLDTNAVIDLLKGNSNLEKRLISAEWIGISIITFLEFNSYSNLTDNDRNLFHIFSNRVQTIDLNQNDLKLINKIIDIRLKYKIKLPDSIIAATTLINNSVLVTRDKGYNKINELKILDF